MAFDPTAASFHRVPRGLIAVSGKEAVQFLDGMISNDMKTLEDGQEMLAAFPNAQGRLIAVIRVLRQDDRFLIETEDATREKVFQNLFRFTFAGDFYVEDLSDSYDFAHIFNMPAQSDEGSFVFNTGRVPGVFVEKGSGFVLCEALEIGDVEFESRRIAAGLPLYGVDMDETTIVPELGLDGLISYNKGCYIGQEIIARIYFRGHVAKRLTALNLSASVPSGAELMSNDGKPAGKITSIAHVEGLGPIALAYIRYDYLTNGTELTANGTPATVTELPF